MTITIPTGPPPPDVYLSFSAEITVGTAERLIDQMAAYANQGAKHVYLMLTSQGGSVMHGLNLYNVLAGMPFELTIHNVGSVESIGNAVYMAGDHRYACSNATFMFHGVANSPGTPVLTERLLQESLASVQSDQQRIAQILGANSDLTPDQIETMFLQAEVKDALAAVDLGIAHEVREVEIRAGVPVHALTFQR